ncbi:MULTISPECIES: hypothetical protein [Gordonibacter]|uniref:DUF4355 domain-containing protein n=1 Tax=Gordonibacter faecis TaxID=3047475 RepID=A0ABT7DSQ2_9ACTN|nr:MULTISPECIES: hypothetical protein [unclassified Gordonibacter]MDJ1651633.1 hypothetical protein [Gordonibacter sp. KGMB12511]HIW77055.1 hypothetical protein [Candidatus Gordonibacter avicola]
MGDEITAVEQDEKTDEATEVDTAEAKPKEAATDEFTPITTQEELNKIISARVKREKAKTAAAIKRAETAEGLVAEKDALLAEKDAEKDLATWKAEAAKKNGVPAELLRGETKEELEAHAEELAKFVAPATPVVTGDGEQPSTGGKPDPWADLAASVFGRD